MQINYFSFIINLISVHVTFCLLAEIEQIHLALNDEFYSTNFAIKLPISFNLINALSWHLYSKNVYFLNENQVKLVEKKRKIIGLLHTWIVVELLNFWQDGWRIKLEIRLLLLLHQMAGNSPGRAVVNLVCNLVGMKVWAFEYFTPYLVFMMDSTIGL